MKKLIPTSLAFLCIMTSSASFPNQLSATENKSNIKFYLKSASSILCTILPAFIASAAFKPRNASQISSNSERQPYLTNLISSHSSQDMTEQNLYSEPLPSDSVSLTNLMNYYRESHAKQAQLIIATRLKLDKKEIEIIELSDEDLFSTHNKDASYNHTIDNINELYEKNLDNTRIPIQQHIKYVSLNKLREKGANKDNCFYKVYKYNDYFYRILGCYDTNNTYNTNFKLLNMSALYANRDVYNHLAEALELFDQSNYVVSLVPFMHNY